ncbi:anti-sigma F factor antagonist [Candidatus Epulonipiscium fishelsonii]|uniref:Anti-sigma F factor antagonist n=1 Tax=Candidatus Epulonipiscium fishelsonii TaxID=77094 RepID=A0ACC8X8F9_9FIRM|nr:anti-sigma F factor antagonist [Epulopiscium sp. SCG-B11WGA-EpuloA1]ONI39606.1 anti-sigma F factor antagonist [Epulopiscium sp. SCG-B05WGA-EpuloA1]
MTFEKNLTNSTLQIKLKGRLDATTTPRLEMELNEDLKVIKKLIFDFKDLNYLSSAGLRVILTAQKIMNKQGSMVIKNVNSTIMEIFESTGFIDILTIEN